MIQVTKFEPRDDPMPANQFGAGTYGEWCKCEVERFGKGAVYVEAWVKVDLEKPFNVPDEERLLITTSDDPDASIWCRVDRV